MAKVYVVLDWSYTDSRLNLQGVFSSLEKAEELMAVYGGSVIQEHELDEYDSRNGYLWDVVVCHSGAVGVYFIDGASCPDEVRALEGTVKREERRFTAYIRAGSSKEAQEIAEVKRLQLVAIGEWPEDDPKT